MLYALWTFREYSGERGLVLPCSMLVCKISSLYMSIRWALTLLIAIVTPIHSLDQGRGPLPAAWPAGRSQVT